MNIQMQLAGFGVLVLLLCFYVRRKAVGLYTEIFFRRTMIVTLANVTMDILSVIAIVHRDEIPDWLCIGICKLYLALLIWTGCFGLLYICQDIYRGKARIHAQAFFGALAVLGNFLIYFFPIRIYHQGDVVYTFGASVSVTYGFCIFFVILTLVMAIYNRNRMNRVRVEAVVMWILVWMLAAVIQFFFNQFLLVGYASCIGMMILFFKLENPDAMIDRETGVFNSHAFYKYLVQLYDRKKECSLLMVRLEQKEDGDPGDEARINSVARFLDSLHEAKVFKNVEREFIVLFEDQELFDEAVSTVMERFDGEWNGRILEPYYIVIKDSRVAESAEEIYQLLRYYKQEQNQNQLSVSHVMEIDQDVVEERRRWVQMIKTIVDALREDRVTVYFQPIYSIEKDRFTSAEALVLILDRDGTLIPPGRIIPVAEETGLVDQLGERVFKKVCQFIQREQSWKWGLEYIEVNLSVRQCESRTLADRYVTIMERYGVEPSMINLEVTESASIQTREIILQNMEKLIQYGVSFSLDDFGNGESNLNYILDMPVEIVKFDRGMTQSYFEKSKGKLVMETTIHMILDLGLKMVSEGVETEEQLEAMKKLGVHYIQGYYFSKPLPAEEFVRFVRDAVNRRS
jgi:EAL domain-containing protein (putative c-di-GMP-specific phosphodiesterase class I)